MEWLEAIVKVLGLLFICITVLGVVVTIWDNSKLEEENEKLKAELQKARSRKLKSEYKKVKDVK